MSKGKATSKPTQSQKLIEKFKQKLREVNNSLMWENVKREEQLKELYTSFDQILIAVSGDAYRQGVADGKRNRDKKIEVIDHSDWA